MLTPLDWLRNCFAASPHVRLEVAALSKRFVTAVMFARKRFFSRVKSLVNCKITIQTECLATTIAYIGLVTRVRALVRIQMAKLRKLRIADIARIRPLARVSPDVIYQSASVCKRSAASVTHVRFFSCVGVHVVAQLSWTGESRTAARMPTREGINSTSYGEP